MRVSSALMSRSKENKSCMRVDKRLDLKSASVPDSLCTERCLQTANKQGARGFEIMVVLSIFTRPSRPS